MEEVRTLRVDKTMIDVFVGRNLHILDHDQEGSMTITDAMNADYLKEVIGWLGEISFERIFLYHKDGYISEWIDGIGFKYVPKNSTELYLWFLEVCKKRTENGQNILQ